MSNKLIVLWGTIIVLLVSAVFVIGKLYKEDKFLIETQKLLKTNVSKYLDDYGKWPSINDEIKISSNELIELDYIEPIKNESKECSAVISIKNVNKKYKYKYTVNCFTE